MMGYTDLFGKWRRDDICQLLVYPELGEGEGN